MENEIGKRIKMLRETLGLTQKEFATKLGRTVRAVQRYEGGQRSPDETTLRLIEQTFSVNPEWLRHGKGEMFLQKKEEPKEEPLQELFRAMERLEGKVPKAVKKALLRAVKNRDVEGILEIMAGYLQDIAEEAKAGTLKIQGNIAIGSSNVQVYNDGKSKEG